MRKKAISTIVVTVILVAIGLIAVGMVWAVISNLITESSEESSFEKLTVDAQIMGVEVDGTANTILVLVKRNQGAGELEKFRFLLKNGTDSEVTAVNATTMKELEQRIFTVSPIMNVSTVLTMDLIPVVISGDRELFGVEKTYNVKTGKGIS